jgi:hypothetical protein
MSKPCAGERRESRERLSDATHALPFPLGFARYLLTATRAALADRTAVTLPHTLLS